MSQDFALKDPDLHPAGAIGGEGSGMAEIDIGTIAYARDSGLRWPDDMVGIPVATANPASSGRNPGSIVQP